MTAYCRRKVCALPEEAKAETVHPGFSHKFTLMITVQTKEWFDRVNGNTYFSAEVFLGMDKIMSLPFQYGYGGARQEVENRLAKHFNSCAERWEVRDMLRKNGIEISESKTKSLKRNLSKESFEDFTPFLKPENLALYAYHRMQQGIALSHHTMENVFVDWLTPDAIGVTLSDGSNELLPFGLFNWF